VADREPAKASDKDTNARIIRMIMLPQVRDALLIRCLLNRMDANVMLHDSLVGADSRAMWRYIDAMQKPFLLGLCR
jgi:hypothetical protein